jgi:catechol 2,3-dioxygenase-like lactoylglutathione lyase family enzyme
MKLAHARLVTNDVPALTRFYQTVTGMTPKGDDRYVELHSQTLTLAISSQRPSISTLLARPRRQPTARSSISKSRMSIGSANASVTS